MFLVSILVHTPLINNLHVPYMIFSYNKHATFTLVFDMCVYLLYSLLHWHSPSVDTLYLKIFNAKIFLSVYPAPKINLRVSLGAPKIFSLCKTGRGHLVKVHSDPHSIIASLSGWRPFAHSIIHWLWKS